ncbi:MAG: LacI family DNA-binding transcriptional regulator [Fimbriimonas sp.]
MSVRLMDVTKPATLKQIAARAGVGTTAASVVLNGAKSGTRVSEETRQAILRAAQELNYRPNGLAQSLRKRRTGIVGYFSGYEAIDPRNQYIAEVMSGLQAGCVRHRLDLLLYTPLATHTPEEIVANLSNGRLDGLVMTSRPEHPIATLLTQAHLPVVAIADPIPGLPSVVANAYGGGQMQARHLFERGHRRVLYLPADFPFPSVQERHRGFLDTAASLGMEVLEGCPLHGHHPELGPRDDFRVLMPPEDVERLQGANRATAVQCWDDAPAHRIASQLADAGFRVPEDVAIMGYNGGIPAVEPRWKLSTIHAPWREIAAAAIDTLHSRIEGLAVPDLQTLPVELVVGQTT